MRNLVFSLFPVVVAIISVSCSDKKSPAPTSFKVIGDAYRIDMAGKDGYPGDLSVGVPDVPPIMTKQFTSFYQGGTRKNYGGDVTVNGDTQFGFRRIDETKPASLRKAAGKSDQYNLDNVKYVFYASNKGDTTAFLVTGETEVVGFENPESMAYLYKGPLTGTGNIILKLR